MASLLEFNFSHGLHMGNKEVSNHFMNQVRIKWGTAVGALIEGASLPVIYTWL